MNVYFPKSKTPLKAPIQTRYMRIEIKKAPCHFKVPFVYLKEPALINHYLNNPESHHHRYRLVFHQAQIRR